MPTESLESGDRLLDHRYIVGAEDGFDNGQDRRGVDEEVARELLNKRDKDLEGNLNISGRLRVNYEGQREQVKAIWVCGCILTLIGASKHRERLSFPETRRLWSACCDEC